MSELASYNDDQTLLSNRLVRYGLIWGVWTIVTLFFSTQAYLMNWEPTRRMPYTQALLSRRQLVISGRLPRRSSSGLRGATALNVTTGCDACCFTSSSVLR